MPFVTIRLVREGIADDPLGKKARIGAMVSDAIAEATGLSSDDVWIVFEEVAGRDWFVGAANVETRQKAEKL